jgi:hypothetical protein
MALTFAPSASTRTAGSSNISGKPSKPVGQGFTRFTGSPKAATTQTTILYWADTVVSTDQMQAALQGLPSQYSVTIASGDSDFATKIGSGDYQIGILFIQGSFSSSYSSPAALDSFVANGGRAIYADWSRNNTFAGAFDASFTGNANDSTVTVTDPRLTPNLPSNPFSLTNPGYGIFSTGLAVLTGGSTSATFSTAESAIIVGNNNRTIMNGFLNDTVPSSDLFHNEIILISPSCVPPPSGMTHWWPADGGADDIVGGNDGALQNGASFGTGKVHQAFSLNGSSQYVDVGNPIGLQISSGDFTIDAWVRFNSLSTNLSGDMSIMDKIHNGNNDGWRLIKQSDNRFWFCFGAGSNQCGNSTHTVFSTTTATTNTWYHVTVAKTSSAFSIYVNGNLEDTRATPGFVDSNTTNLLLGGNTEQASYLDGFIDETEVFNRALGPDEIAAISNAGSAGKCRSCVPAPGGLIGWWKGDGDTRDAQANNNATFNGTPAFAPGEVDQAFSFGGNVANYVSIAPAADLDLAQFTIDAWVFPTTSSGVRYILAKEPPASNSSNYYLALEDGNFIEFGFMPGQYQFVDSNLAVPANAWSHIAGTYDGATLKLYINGAINVTTNADPSFLVPPFGQPLAIGSRASNNTDAFVGLIDEVEVFGRALSDAEVHKIYDGGSDGKCPCVQLSPGMVGWWPGEGDASDIQGGNNGILQNGVTFVTGEVGQGFSLNGTDQSVEITSNENLEITGAISVDAWVKADDLTGLRTIVSKYNNGDLSQRSWFLGIRDGIIQWGVQNGSTYRYVDAPNPVSTGVWMHIAGTFDPNTQDVKIYVDGVDIAAPLEGGSGTVSTIGTGIGTPIEIGRLFNGDPSVQDFFAGVIDEVEIFNRPLTPDEVASIYNAGGAGKCANRIDVSASPGAGGTVSGGGKHAAGSTATVVATPNSCYSFVSWTEGNTVVSNSASYSFTVTSDRKLVANFTKIQYTISTSSSPSAGGSVSGAGPYDCGSTVQLVATANSCYAFVNWTEGSSVVSTSATYSFTASSDRTLVANFRKIQYTISTSSSPSAGGSVSGAGNYDCGANVQLVATPNSCYTFTGWSENGVVISGSQTLTFTASANRTLVANFGIKHYQIVATASPAAGGIFKGDGSYDCGATVTMVAKANNNYRFTKWTENNVTVTTSTSFSFTAGSNRTFVANFEAASTAKPTVNVTVSPASIKEGQSAVFTISVTPANHSTFTVYYHFTGKATYKNDFTLNAPISNLVIPAFQQGAITLQSIKDNVKEGTEPATIEFNYNPNYNTGPKSSATVNIND